VGVHRRERGLEDPGPQRVLPPELLDQFPASVIITDPQGHVTAWNKGAEELYGWAAQEVLGRDATPVLVQDEDRRRAEEIMGRLGAGQTWEGEFPIRRKDGTVILVYASDGPLFAADGSLAGFIGISMPVTMRAPLEDDLRRSRDQLETVLHNVTDGITVQDVTGKLVYANDAAARLIGYPTAAALLATPLEELMHPFEVLDEQGRLLPASELPGRRALLGEPVQDTVLQFRTRGQPTERWALVSAAPIADDDGAVRITVNVFRDITEIKRAEERLTFLARAGELLSSSLDYHQTLERLADLVVPRLADWFAVDMLEEDGSLRSLVVAHADPEKTAWARRFREDYPPDPESAEGLSEALRTGLPQLYPDIPPEALEAAARDEEHLRILRELGMTSALIVPFSARGQTSGVITFIYAEQGRRFGSEDLALAEELARRAALAIDNARLHEDERRARHAAEEAAQWTSQLQAITTHLAWALDPEAVAEVVLGEGLAAMRAAGGGMYLLAEDDREVRLVRPAGVADEFFEGETIIPVDSGSPVTDAVRKAEPLFFRSRAELFRRYRQMEGRVRETHAAWAILPIQLAGPALGSLVVSFAEPRGFGEVDRAFLLALAQQAAQALERAALYEGERQARTEAEAANQRLMHLEAISRAGLTHLDLDNLLQELLARIKEIASADRAVILLNEDDELMVRAAIGLEEEVAAGVRVPIGRGIAGTIAATAKPLVIEDMSTVQPVSAYLRERARSLAGVPLLIEGEVIGVLHVSTDAPRRFTVEEIGILEMVAARAALAIHQARVFQRQHWISETLQRSLLPESLPEIPGLEVAARYIPSGRGLDVGGDWFDAIELSDGLVGLVVGDVVGHGLRAAAVMGQLRSAFRAYAVEGHGPGVILERVDRMDPAPDREAIATALCLVLDPGSGELVYASAGHPPPLVVAPDGHARFLEGGRSVPLGAVDGVTFPEATDHVTAGSAILLYTDGLVESRELSIDEGLRRLRETASGAQGRADRIADQVLSTMLADREPGDDVALLVVRIQDRTPTD
jgi:PAS domain S-box-containing protein